MAWHDLFIYSFIFPPLPSPFPVKLHHERPALILVDWEGWTHPRWNTRKHTLPQSTSVSISLAVFHTSFGFVVHKSAKCPFQAAHKHPHRSPKMPPNSEARAIDGGEPTEVQLPTARKWWMSERECIWNVYIKSVRGRADGFEALPWRRPSCSS